MKTIKNETSEKKGFNLLYEYLRYHNDTVSFINKMNFGDYKGLFKPTSKSEISEPLSYIKFEVLLNLMKDEVTKKRVWRKFYQALRDEVFPEIQDALAKEYPEYQLPKSEA